MVPDTTAICQYMIEQTLLGRPGWLQRLRFETLFPGRPGRPVEGEAKVRRDHYERIDELL